MKFKNMVSIDAQHFYTKLKPDKYYKLCPQILLTVTDMDIATTAQVHFNDYFNLQK